MFRGLGEIHHPNGSGVIVGAGRANDLPNINPGHFWVGDSDWVPQAVSTSSFVTTSSFNDATGSFLTTGSVTNNTITLEKGDGSTFSLTVDTGSGGSGGNDIDVYDDGTLVRASIEGLNFAGNGFDVTTSGSNGVTITNENVDVQFLADFGTITHFGPSGSGIAPSGSGYLVLSGSDSHVTDLDIASPSGVYGGEGVWAGLNISYHDRGFNTRVNIFDSTTGRRTGFVGQVGRRTVLDLKETGFYILNLTQTGADWQLEFGATYGSGSSALPGAPLTSKQTDSTSIYPGTAEDFEIISTYHELNISTTGSPGDTLTFKGGRTGRPIPPGTVVTVRLDITTSSGYLNTQFWDGNSNVAIESTISGTSTRIYTFVAHDSGTQGLMLLKNLTL